MNYTQDIYLLKEYAEAIGFNPTLGREIEDTLDRIEDGTYEYVGEVKLKVKYRNKEIHDGW